MNVFCSVQEPYFLIFACLQVLKTEERNATIFPSIFRLHAPL